MSVSLEYHRTKKSPVYTSGFEIVTGGVDPDFEKILKDISEIAEVKPEDLENVELAVAYTVKSAPSDKKSDENSDDDDKKDGGIEDLIEDVPVESKPVDVNRYIGDESV